MKRKLFKSIIFLLVFSNYTWAQTAYLVQYHTTEAQKLIEILKVDNKIAPNFEISLERAITNYVSYYFYAPKQADILFDLIIGSTHSLKNEYYRFLLLNAEYFSELQLKFIKRDLSSILLRSDPQFYDIVSIYHLNEYKEIIASEIDSAYFNKLRAAFGINSASRELGKARPIITLANLGEVALEDSIINIVKEFYTLCQKNSDTLSKRSYYDDLYSGIVPKILGKLNSKRSVEQTLYLMLDEYVISFSEHRTMACELYVIYVVSPKVSRRDQSYIQTSLVEIRNRKLSSNIFVENLYAQLKNGSLKWKEILNDVDK